MLWKIRSYKSLFKHTILINQTKFTKNMNQQVGVKAIIVNNNKILLIKRSQNYEQLVDQWDIPGGRINFGEEPIIGLKREILEETGLELKEVFDILDASTIFLSKDMHIVRITYLVKCSGQISLSGEHTESKWFSLDEITFPLKDHLLQKVVDNLKKSRVLEQNEF